jgi:exopolysaccharide production protein ExoZ
VVNAWRAGGLSADRLAATFLFWPTAGSGISFPYVQPGWTLCFEMVFYLTVSLVLVGGRLGRNLAIGAAVVAALIAARLALDGAALRFLVNPIFLEFAGGVVLAAASRRLARAPLRLGLLLLGLGACALAVEPFMGLGDVGKATRVLLGQGAFARVLLLGAPATAIVGGALICERLCRGALAALLARFGDASYAIYLTHFAAINLVGMAWIRLRGPVSTPAVAGCALAVALAIGLLCHRVIERPILRDLKRLSVPWPPWRTNSAIETPT